MLSWPSIVPSNLAIRLQGHDPDRHVVQTHRVIVECLAVHVHDEGVTDGCDRITCGIHQHARTVDGDMPVWIGQHPKDRCGVCRNGPLSL